MRRLKSLITLSLAGTLLAPAALAQKMPMSHRMSPMGVLPGGISFLGQVDHAYQEALNAHAAVAMGMSDMAANHLSNVDMVIANLTQVDTSLDTDTKNRLSAIRQDAANLKGNLSDRTAALTGTTALVGRFASLMDQVASRNLGGGGGGANRPNMAVAEILADAAQSAAMGQEALAGRDFETAQIHVRDLTRHLDQAQRAAAMPMARVASADKQRIQALKRQAQTLDSQVSSRSNSAVRTAGNLVTQIGRDLPHFAQAPAGGGAGMPMNR